LVGDWKSFWQLRRLENPSKGLIASRRPVEIRFRALGGAPVHLRPGTQDDSLPQDVFLKSHHLPPTSIPADELKVVWDLGANAGLTIAHMARLLPEARIWGVELDEENARLCRLNIAPWGERCKVIHAAVWVADGTIAYHRPAGREQSFRVALAPPDPSAGPPAPGVSRPSAPALSLNTLFERTGPRVDYVKMDIEGAEMQVLKRDTDWADHVRALKVEVHAPYTVEQCIEDLGLLGFHTEPLPKRRGGVLGIRSI
jgi:FkbM family methyltransferase